jgi:hypothetical protein
MARVAFKTAFGSFPKQGNRALPITLDFTPANVALISDDLSPEMQASQIESVQAIYVDNSANPNPSNFVFGSYQPLMVKPGKQGVYPVIAQGSLQYTAATPNGVKVFIMFLNNTANTYGEWGGA